MRRSRGERRDLALRKRLHKYNQLRDSYAGWWNPNSRIWRIAKTDSYWPRWTRDPEPEDAFLYSMRQKEEKHGIWSDRDKKSYQEAKEV